MSKHTRQKSVVAASRRPSPWTWIGVGVALVALLLVSAALFAGRSDEEAAQSVSGVSPTESQTSRSARPVVDVYKDATCGCCSKWVEHLREQGFEVRTTDTRELAAFKASHGVPRQMESCHTALVAGYVVEGHVPAADVRRLLEERPAITGLAVPGMPTGSPGMEVAGGRTEAYDVVAFDRDGSTRVFAKHGR